MLKKIIAVFALITLCFSFASCSHDGTPDGMKSVTLEGEPFILYVPESWTDNTASGISGAFVGSMSINARYRTLESGVTLADYVNTLSASYANSLEDFKVISSASSVLGGSDATVLRYSAKHGGDDYTFVEYVTLYKGDVISLKFVCPTSIYEQNAQSFDEVASVFVLRDKPAVPNDAVTDDKTPEGMKIASGDNVEYVLYVPMSWVCSAQSGASEAYVSESGRPNVTVTSFSPDEPLTVEEYFELASKSYQKELAGYTLISESGRKIHGLDAVSYLYSVVYGNVTYKIMQTVTVYNGMVYSITYTAPADSFDTHTADVESILNAFIFR